jgi:hypothetical protein
MTMRRVYIETSVWGMVAPGQSAALRELTLEFLEQCAGRVRLPHVSAIVADEVGRAPAAVQQHVVPKLNEVNPLLLPITSAAESLAARFLQEGVLPPRRLDDARHVSCALASELDLLVSWNYRHIANVRKAEAFNALAVLAGLRGGLEIHTPLEVLEWK